MLENCRRIYTTHAWPWIRCKVHFTNTNDYLGHLASPGQLRIRHNQLTLFRESSTMLAWQNSDQFNVHETSCHASVQIWLLSALLNKKPHQGQLQICKGLADNKINALETLQWKSVGPSGSALPGLQCAHSIDTNACSQQTGWTTSIRLLLQKSSILLQIWPARTERPIRYRFFPIDD